jgi:hypothetical protein
MQGCINNAYTTHQSQYNQSIAHVHNHVHDPVVLDLVSLQAGLRVQRPVTKPVVIVMYSEEAMFAGLKHPNTASAVSSTVRASPTWMMGMMPSTEQLIRSMRAKAAPTVHGCARHFARSILRERERESHTHVGLASNFHRPQQDCVTQSGKMLCRLMPLMAEILQTAPQ